MLYGDSAGKGRVGLSRAGQGRAGQGRAGQGLTDDNLDGTFMASPPPSKLTCCYGNMSS